MIDQDARSKGQEILKKILNSEKILIIASSPVDNDSLGTALALKRFLKKRDKDSRIVLFAHVPETKKNFPHIDEVENLYPDKVDFGFYDAIVLVDGNSWKQFFTQMPDLYVNSLDKSKIFNIDHHQSGELETLIPENTLRVLESCTAKVLCDYVFDRTEVDKEIAELLFYALVGDTGKFNWGIYKDTFQFADFLYSFDLDYSKITDFRIPKRELDCAIWLAGITNYYQDVGLSTVVLDEKEIRDAKEVFGDEWEEEDLDNYYKFAIARVVIGYPLFIKFQFRPQYNDTRISWRANTSLRNINLLQMLKKLGFTAGGHLGAGGGDIKLRPKEAERIVLEELRRGFN